MSSALVKASTQLSQFLGIDPGHMVSTIKAQCFKCDPAKVSDEMMAAFVAVANEMKVNPLLPGMLYAYPDNRGGIVPMMGPDGVFKKLSENAVIESWEVVVYPEDATAAPTHAVARIWRKGIEKALTFTAYFAEWKIQSNPNWNTRPRHMLYIRALKQCARQVIHGIPFDEDERQILRNVTGTGDDAGGAESEQRAERPPMPERTGGVKAARDEAAGATGGKADSKIVEAEFTEQPRTGETGGAGSAGQANAAAPAEGATKAAGEAPAPKRLTALNAGQKIDVRCTVLEVVNFTASGKPSVRCKVEGEYNGVVLHLGGNADAWKEKEVILSLVGQKLTKDAKIGGVDYKANDVLATVSKVEAAVADEAPAFENA